MVDGSVLLNGSDCVFSDIPVERDDILTALITPNASLDHMTKQILELMCCSFVAVCHNMLQDHLEGGRHTLLTEQKMVETCSVPSDNIGPERDFSHLDRSILVKPSLSTVNLEGMFMFYVNRVSDWMKGKSKSEKQELHRMVRKSVDKQRIHFLQRQATIAADQVQ